MMEARFPLRLRFWSADRPRSVRECGDSARSVSVVLMMLHLAVQPLVQGGVGDMAAAEALFFGGGSLVLWVWTLLQGHVAPPWPRLLWGPLLGLLVTGWIAASNPEFRWREDGNCFEAVEGHFSALPGCVDSRTAVRSLLWSTLEVLLILSLWDHLRYPLMAGRLWAGLRWGGAVLLSLAILQKASDCERIFFLGSRVSNAFFGSFLYSGSAAAYINLLLPAYMHGIWQQKQVGLSRVCAGACIACLVCNTSRIGFAVGLLQLGVFSMAAWHRTRGARGGPGSPIRSGLRSWRSPPQLRRCLAVAGALGLAALFPVPPILQKWRLLPQQWNENNPRLQAWKIALIAAPDASLWGLGPGSFPLIFPFYANRVPHSLKGRWVHAHCDYLELWIERGAAGALLMAGLFGGTLMRLLMRRRAGLMCHAAALGGVCLHAAADFPFQNPCVQLLAGLWMVQVWQDSPEKKSVLDAEQLP